MGNRGFFYAFIQTNTDTLSSLNSGGDELFKSYATTPLREGGEEIVNPGDDIFETPFISKLLIRNAWCFYPLEGIPFRGC